MSASPTRLVDVHHHIFPSSLPKQSISRSLGFRTPPSHLPWTPSISLRAMDALGVELALLSIPPGHFSDARAVNEQMRETCMHHPGRFAFWGCAGDLRDTKGALELIKYAMDDLEAVGIAISSVYGKGAEAKYIGDNLFDPIWEELDRRKAVIFLHGAQTPSSTPFPSELLGIPITEVPNETFKAITHLIVTGKTRRFRNLAFVLAHMGGSTLVLAPRAAALSRYMGSRLSESEIMDELKRCCWWDSALSTGAGPLGAVEACGVGERVLWGSDFPAVPLETIRWFEGNLKSFYATRAAADDIGHKRLRGIYRDNVLSLFASRGVDLFHFTTGK
ncbi:hypothetical protein EW146_g5238 [Bondarzewia mesenterica]|uniref:Amidohydrolase-related domain-containing protein n=1 Tax=Bondarzewia mesenterica TaxID=1095465 RepID=A0A4S4LTZ1_9AGAM|nr:hypothetical protein EW146_g5238 [Bondarzewia mesenterica]